MAKKPVKKLVADLVEEFLEENGLELYNVTFAKEGRDNCLTVYIDIAGTPDDRFVSSDDCEKVSRFLSETLDETGAISGKYYLVVSSPGIDRRLFELKDYKRFSGSNVEIRLYKQYDGSKEYKGYLVGVIGENIEIRLDDGREISLPFKSIAKANLAVEF